MFVFEVLLNGKLVATAGAENLGVLTQSLCAYGKLGPASLGTRTVKDTCFVDARVGGLTSAAEASEQVHLEWFCERVGVGDEMTVRVVERPDADAPSVVPGPRDR